MGFIAASLLVRAHITVGRAGVLTPARMHSAHSHEALRPTSPLGNLPRIQTFRKVVAPNQASLNLAGDPSGRQMRPSLYYHTFLWDCQRFLCGEGSHFPHAESLRHSRWIARKVFPMPLPSTRPVRLPVTLRLRLIFLALTGLLAFLLGVLRLHTASRPPDAAERARLVARTPPGMVLVPGGDCWIGTNDSDADDDVRPMRRVFVPSFY